MTPIFPYFTAYWLDIANDAIAIGIRELSVAHPDQDTLKAMMQDAGFERAWIITI